MAILSRDVSPSEQFLRVYLRYRYGSTMAVNPKFLVNGFMAEIM
jgi:hypothetical protein